MVAKRSSRRHRPFPGLVFLRNLLLLLPLLLFAGCGDVDWFPEYERDPTTPDPFSFVTKKGVEPGEAVTSDPVTISGITAGSAPISISGNGSAGKYSINGKAATDVKGTVSNGDQVTVTHTASKEVGATTTTEVMIGNLRGTFSSINRTVSLSWQPTTVVGEYRQAIALVTANDTVAGGHVISIKDSLETSFPRFAVTDSFNDPTGGFKTDEVTIYTLNNQRIFVQNKRTNNAMTILTIDGTDFSVDLSD
jgi:hypothetical protein